MMIDYSKLKPIPKSVTENDVTTSHERVVIKYSAKDLEAANKVGRFFLPMDMWKTGEYVLEYGTVIATSDENGWLKVGDEVASSYSLLQVERGNRGEDLYAEDWLGKDEEGNEYVITTLQYFNVFAKIVGDKLDPLRGWLFCELPQIEEIKTSKIFVPETNKKLTTDKKAYKTKIIFINEKDKTDNPLLVKLKEGDEIICKKNSDIPIKIKGVSYIRVQIDDVVCKVSELQKLKFEKV